MCDTTTPSPAPAAASSLPALSTTPAVHFAQPVPALTTLPVSSLPPVFVPTPAVLVGPAAAGVVVA